MDDFTRQALAEVATLTPGQVAAWQREALAWAETALGVTDA